MSKRNCESSGEYRRYVFANGRVLNCYRSPTKKRMARAELLQIANAVKMYRYPSRKVGICFFLSLFHDEK